MSALSFPKGSKHTRKLLPPFAGLVGLSVLLQLVALLAMIMIGEARESGRLRVAVAANQRALAAQYESATYLALVALSATDLDMLLEQRRAAKDAETRLERDIQGLLTRTDDPALAAALGQAPTLLAEMKQAHIRVLRSNNQELKGNPELEQFQIASGRLRTLLSSIQDMVDLRTEAALASLDWVQRLIPFGALALTLALGAFVLKWLLTPLGASMDDLEKGAAELRVARDGLEERVAERTRELATANEELRRAEEQLRVANEDLERRVAERTRELKEAQRRSLDLARQAGMAEIASNVLHNVGNVLNSVNTTTALLHERLGSPKFEMLGKVASLLEEQRDSLESFLTKDERGKKLPEYVGKLSEHLLTERREMMDATATLHGHVEHIRMIVDVQQSYAKTSVLEEIASVSDVIEDALRISAAALGRHEVTIERHITPMPSVLIDKHKVLQIILNLVSNAKYSLADKDPVDRLIDVRLERTPDGRLCVRVTDNGVGIAPETMARLFQHGFTTRKDGHGFGLHSSVLAAQALGGSLSAHSEGPGKGATFTLELPLRLAES